MRATHAASSERPAAQVASRPTWLLPLPNPACQYRGNPIEDHMTEKRWQSYEEEIYV